MHLIAAAMLLIYNFNLFVKIIVVGVLSVKVVIMCYVCGDLLLLGVHLILFSMHAV